jgi:hypothetical protein
MEYLKSGVFISLDFLGRDNAGHDYNLVKGGGHAPVCLVFRQCRVMCTYTALVWRHAT